MRKCLLRKGTKIDFEEYYKDKMNVGECCALTDKHTLVFKFGEKDIQELSFEDIVTNEKADELIKSIKEFIEKK